MTLLKLTFKELAGAIIHYTGVFRLILFINKNDTKLIVFNYHNFSKYNNYKLKRGHILETGYADNFEKQIQFLKRHFNFSFPETFFTIKGSKAIDIILTFDDGYKDNYDIAFPILKKHNAKSIFFVVTNKIGSSDWLLHDKIRFLILKGVIEEKFAEKCLKEMNSGYPLPQSILEIVHNYEFPKNKRLMMNWDELSEIYDNGFMVQPHTHNHSILSFLELDEQKIEVKNSIDSIKLNLGISTTCFAYPNGLFNNSTIELLKSFKIDYALTTISGINNNQTDHLRLKRIGVNASDSIGVLCLKIMLNLFK